MDIVNLAYYALICGLLAFAAPNVKPLVVRVGVGAVVGLVAAALLPYVKVVLGS